MPGHQFKILLRVLKTGIRVEALVLNPLASADAVLLPSEKELCGFVILVEERPKLPYFEKEVFGILQ